MEFIVQKEWGKVKLVISLGASLSTDTKYNVRISGILPNGCRNWRDINKDIRNSFEYRQKNLADRALYAKEKICEYVTGEDIEKALNAFYATLAPCNNNVAYNIL